MHFLNASHIQEKLQLNLKANQEKNNQIPQLPWQIKILSLHYIVAYREYSLTLPSYESLLTCVIVGGKDIYYCHAN